MWRFRVRRVVLRLVSLCRVIQALILQVLLPVPLTLLQFMPTQSLIMFTFNYPAVLGSQLRCFNNEMRHRVLCGIATAAAMRLFVS